MERFRRWWDSDDEYVDDDEDVDDSVWSTKEINRVFDVFPGSVNYLIWLIVDWLWGRNISFYENEFKP